MSAETSKLTCLGPIGLLRAQVPNSGTTVLVKAAGLNHLLALDSERPGRRNDYAELTATYELVYNPAPVKHPLSLAERQGVKGGTNETVRNVERCDPIVAGAAA